MVMNVNIERFNVPKSRKYLKLKFLALHGMLEARITSLSIKFIVVQHHNLRPEVIILIKKTHNSTQISEKNDYF